MCDRLCKCEQATSRAGTTSAAASAGSSSAASEHKKGRKEKQSREKERDSEREKEGLPKVGITKERMRGPFELMDEHNDLDFVGAVARADRLTSIIHKFEFGYIRSFFPPAKTLPLEAELLNEADSSDARNNLVSTCFLLGL